MSQLENFLLDDGPQKELSVDRLLEASEFFMELKQPLDSGMAKEAMSLKMPKAPKVPKTKMPKAAKEARETVKSSLAKAGVKTAPLKPQKAKLKVAFLRRALREGAHAGQAAARSQKASAGAFRSGFTDEASPSKIKAMWNRLRKKDPESIAKSKGKEYYSRWLSGREARDLLDPQGTVRAMNKELRNKAGDITPTSVIAGLDRTGMLPLDKMVEGGFSATQGLQKMRADRIAAKKFNRNLMMGGAAAGGGAYLLGRNLNKGKQKEAKLRVSDIEDHLGEYFPDSQESKVRAMIGKAREKSFAMRHPYLTGIPTLGIAPTVANENAKAKIVRSLLRKDPGLRKRVRTRNRENWERRMAERRLDIKEMRANAPVSAARHLSAASMGAAGALAAAKREKARLKYSKNDG